MIRGRSRRVLVRHWDGSREHRRPDDLVVEEPLTIRLDDVTVATTMRTPGHDFELAAGFCFTEGLLGDASVTAIRYCMPESAAPDVGPPAEFQSMDRHQGPEPVIANEYNLVTVETDGAPPATPRLGLTTSACGICGAESIEALRERLYPLPEGAMPIDADVLAAVPERVRDSQDLFATTGGVHAAAVFDSAGEPILVREDIGRHNAVDKVVGRLLLDGDLSGQRVAGERDEVVGRLLLDGDLPGQRIAGERDEVVGRLLLDGDLPAGGYGLFVSGRASFEMVQKAWAAGFTTVVAVSAPSALAVETARVAGLCLAGFARDGRLNFYSPGH